MTFHDSARTAVLHAAEDLESKSYRIGLMRSVDATKAARWLEEVAKQLRDACLEPMASLLEGEEGAGEGLTPQEALRRAGASLDSIVDTTLETPDQRLARVTAERNAALAVVRAVYQESKAIRAAYKELPEHLRQEVERPGTAFRCKRHGGYGFQSDCADCLEG